MKTELYYFGVLKITKPHIITLFFSHYPLSSTLARHFGFQNDFLGAKPSLEITYLTHSLPPSGQKVSLFIFLFIFLIYILRKASPLLFSLEIFNSNAVEETVDIDEKVTVDEAAHDEVFKQNFSSKG